MVFGPDGAPRRSHGHPVSLMGELLVVLHALPLLLATDGLAMFRRLISSLSASALAAGLIATGVALTTPPAAAAVPDPGNSSTVVTVKVGGSRTGGSNVTGLQGVTLELWTSDNGQPGTKVNQPWAECTSDTDGDCSFTVPNTNFLASNYLKRFWVKRKATPAGWFGLNGLVTGPSFQLTDYQFRTPRMVAGQTYSSQDDFMIGTGNDNRTASGGIWQTSLNNPAFPPKCGIKVALVLDVSGSVAPQLGNLKTAAKTFVSSLVGTPSQVGLFTFAENAPANNANNQNRPLTPVSTQPGADTVNAWINGLTAGGSTNWDRGLYQVAQSPSQYDVAVIITDGNPTVYGSPAQGPQGFTRFREVENGIFSANAIKSENTRVVAFGVGDGIDGNPANLQAISGTTKDSDYFQTDNYAQAGSALRALAAANCEGTVNVVKQLLPPGGTDLSGATPAGGWTFSAAKSDPASQLTVTPPSGQTAVGTGALSFDVDFGQNVTSGGVTVTEQPQTGYALWPVDGSNAVCTRLSDDEPVAVTDVGGEGFSVTALAGDGISCTVYNRADNPPAQVTVDKEWVVNGAPAVPDGQQPAGLTAALTVAGNGQPWGVPVTGLKQGDQVMLDETVSNTLPLCRVDSQQIRKGDGTPVALGDGFEATLDEGSNGYTMTNTVTCMSRLTLAKQVQGGGASPDSWTLTANGPQGTLPGPSGTTGVNASVTAGATYALTESGGDPRYVQSADPNAMPIPGSTVSWNCKAAGDQGFSDGLNGGVTVPLGYDVTCTASNQTATLTLLKQVVNNNGGTQVASAWDLTASPQGQSIPGLQAVTVDGANSANANNTFNVRPGKTYALTESQVAGYTMDSLECAVNDGDPQPATEIALEPLDTAVCTFTNNDQPGKLTLEKLVNGPAPKSAWTLTADPQGIEGQEPVTGNGDPDSEGGVKNEPVFAGTYLLSESDGPGGYSQSTEWQCTGGTQQGNLITVANGADVHCTVTNDRDVAYLTLVKAVDRGGPEDWTLTATPQEIEGQESVSGNGNPASDGGVDHESVYTGTYTLSEQGPANFSASLWDCQWNNDEVVQPAVVQEDGTVTLESGDDVTCTITNTRDTAELRLVKQVSGSNDPNDWTLTAQAAAPDNDRNISTPGGSGQFETVYAGTQYTLGETGPGGYSPSNWVCSSQDVVAQADIPVSNNGTVTIPRGARVTCTIVNTRDTGSLTIAKEFNPQTSGFAGTFDIAYTCVEGTTAVTSGTVTVGAGQSQTITGLPTGTTCTVSEPTLPTAPAGWSFNPPTLTPADGQVTITARDQAATVTVVNSISQVSPVVVKRTCPINAAMVKPKPKRAGNHLLIKNVKTRSTTCAIVKPVVLCRPVASGAAGETAFCDTTSRRNGRVRVDTQGYDAVKVTVVVRAKPKVGSADNWKPRTWRKSWTLR